MIAIFLVIAWSSLASQARAQPKHRPKSKRELRYDTLRAQMVKSHIIDGGITDQRVIESLRKTPRHEFIPEVNQRRAYFDMALPIGGGQTISPPYVVAFMTQALQPKPTDKVLEIGTGSGYQAAVLSPLVAKVYSIEIVESLGRRSARTLRRLEYKNIHTKVGDGFLGWEEHAPFDKIILTCSPETIPQPLVDQLREGGQIVVPLGERFQQNLDRLTKVNGKLERESLEATFFVPMTGQAEDKRKMQIEETTPRLKHVSFEEPLGKTSAPAGWFYAKSAVTSNRMGATDGEAALVLTGDDSGQHAHVMQAFGIDGRVYSSLTISLDVRGANLVDGERMQEKAGAIVEFYANKRAPVGSRSFPSLQGTFDWEKKTYTVSVPRTARLAIIGLGVFGGTGTLAVDNVSIKAVAEKTATDKSGSNRER